MMSNVLKVTGKAMQVIIKRLSNVDLARVTGFILKHAVYLSI